MYCPRCGTQNDDNNFKCIKCGTIIQQIPYRTVPVKTNGTIAIVISVCVGVMLFIAIVGILAAIAIPQFYAYRTRSYNSAAQADLRNAATAQEAYYVDNSAYTDSIEELVGVNYGFLINEGVTVQIISADRHHYNMIAFHKGGDRKYQIIGPGGTIEAYSE
jgi:type IV pilus assembly protein PilA